MAENNCSNCKLRARYDRRPTSFLGRLWRWHISFCPGWKKYFTSLEADKKKELSKQYDFHKYQ